MDGGKVKSIINNTINSINSMNEGFALMMITAIILLIVVCAIVYYYYMYNLESSECKFLDNIYGKLDGKLHTVTSNNDQCKYTLKDYYIKTAYNCCSGGSYKNDYVSLCVLKNLIRQGVRGFDFEIYSLNDLPVVATSTVDDYHIKETYNSVAFSDVLITIQNYALSMSTCPNPGDPIIFHLRMKSNNQKMYQALADMLKNYDSILLGKEYSYENHGHNLGDVPLLQLAGKIIIIVDRQYNAFLECDDLMEYVNMTSNSIFMRALAYYDVQFTPDITELIEYNKRNMTIVMPDAGIDPPNMSAKLVEAAGCQMIAMRYQKADVNIKANNQTFDECGFAFCLKPEKLRYIPVTVPEPTKQNPALSYATRNVSSNYYNFNI